MKKKINICWFRRDLRLFDNAALYHALRSANPVLAVFIFDSNILDKLDNKKDRRVQFIHDALEEMQKVLLKAGSSLKVLYGTPEECFKEIISEYDVKKVFTNSDYELYARKRDTAIEILLNKNNIEFASYKDHVIFEKEEILKDDGTAYTVFTPYSKKWHAMLKDFYLKSYPTRKYFKNIFQCAEIKIPLMKSIGFEKTGQSFPLKQIERSLIQHYKDTRDYPAIRGTSRLSLHLRFGTVSIRQLATKAKELSPAFLNELIWRDFYHMITWHFLHIGEYKAFKPAYDNIEWRNNRGDFKKWCEGQTGYPIVDAGMRELNETGFMHNRVRMIVASFLSKHLLLDWRLGEAYFAEKLLDYDFAANNGGWQWATGSGCDAAPYFRIFNPSLQTKKFDPELKYIRKWVPEFEELTYPKPMVDHQFARERCLKAYSKALKAK